MNPLRHHLYTNMNFPEHVHREFPKMLYRAALIGDSGKLESLTIKDEEAEETARADGWLDHKDATATFDDKVQDLKDEAAIKKAEEAEKETARIKQLVEERKAKKRGPGRPPKSEGDRADD